jgi:hypothetical protein
MFTRVVQKNVTRLIHTTANGLQIINLKGMNTHDHASEDFVTVFVSLQSYSDAYTGDKEEYGRLTVDSYTPKQHNQRIRQTRKHPKALLSRSHYQGRNTTFLTSSAVKPPTVSC